MTRKQLSVCVCLCVYVRKDDLVPTYCDIKAYREMRENSHLLWTSAINGGEKSTPSSGRLSSKKVPR
jgi:hypothetical protein